MSATDLPTRLRVSSLPTLEARRIIHVERGSCTAAVFSIDGALHAIDGRCPHRGGPLGEGTLRGRVVTCPWHRWSFDATSGRCISHPDRDVRVLPVTVDGDDVVVTIP